jgi:GTP-binding protein EngB required for normal cell division
MILRHLRCTRSIACSTAASGLVGSLSCPQSPSPSSQQHGLLLNPQHRSLATRTKKKPVSQLGSSFRKSKPQHQGRPHARQQKQGNAFAIRPPKNYLERLPKATAEPIIPPAMLAPTASPYVYISQPALVSNYGGGEGGSTIINASTLFAEAINLVSDDGESITARNLLPPLFAKGDFEYFSPKRDLGHDYPSHGVPEVAFLGRSNVGKSSLINALMRRNLCITSKSPGRTRLPYYYGLIPKSENQQQRQPRSRGGTSGTAGKTEKVTTSHNPSTVQGYIIDLPGYGFGKAPKAVVEDWQKDTQDLLLHRRHTAGVLQRLFLLMDTRRGGPTELDRTVMRWLEDADIPYTVVLTKADRVSVPQVVRQVNDYCLRYASLTFNGNVEDEDEGGVVAVAQSPVIHVTSSTERWGIHELMLSVEAEFIGEEEDEFDDEINTNGV